MGRSHAWLALVACAACSFHLTGQAGTPSGDGSPAGPDDAGNMSGSDGGGGTTGSDGATMPVVSLVQSTLAHPAWMPGDAMLAASLPAPIVAGDVIALVLTWDDAHSLNTVDDSASDTFHGPQLVHDTANHKYLFFAWAVSTAGGSPTVTAVFNGAVTGRLMVLAELAGASTSPLDGSNQAAGAATTATDAVKAGAVTTAVAGELVLAGTTETTGTNAEVIAAGTGATMVRSLSATQSGRDAFAVEAYAQVAAGGMNPTFTYGTTGAALCVAASFKP